MDQPGVLRAGDQVRLVGGVRVMTVLEVLATAAGDRCRCHWIDGYRVEQVELHRVADLERAD